MICCCHGCISFAFVCLHFFVYVYLIVISVVLLVERIIAIINTMEIVMLQPNWKRVVACKNSVILRSDVSFNIVI